MNDSPQFEEDEANVTFERADEHVARKRHTCTNCYHDIEPGSSYFRHTALVDGEFIDDKWHLVGQCKPHPPTGGGSYHLSAKFTTLVSAQREWAGLQQCQLRLVEGSSIGSI